MDLIFSWPQNSKGFVTSISRSDEISEFNTDKKRLWVEILNKSIEEPINIKKNEPLGFIVVEPEHLKAYAGRGMVNQAAKVASWVIKAATMISMLLQQTGLLIRLSVRVVKKWREFFLKSYLEQSRTWIRNPSGYWEFFGNKNSKNLKEKY